MFWLNGCICIQVWLVCDIVTTLWLKFHRQTWVNANTHVDETLFFFLFFFGIWRCLTKETPILSIMRSNLDNFRVFPLQQYHLTTCSTFGMCKVISKFIGRLVQDLLDTLKIPKDLQIFGCHSKSVDAIPERTKYTLLDEESEIWYSLG